MASIRSSNKPFKICKVFECNSLTRNTYCKDHEHIAVEKERKRYKNYNVSRDPVLIKFYNSKEWRALRDYIMAVNYFLCIGCSVPGTKPVMADVVDHVVPVLVDWSLRLDPSNCQPLCHACHNTKTEKDKKQYKIKKSRKIYF